MSMLAVTLEQHCQHAGENRQVIRVAANAPRCRAGRRFSVDRMLEGA